jgi:protein-tyrosine phosphatase
LVKIKNWVRLPLKNAYNVRDLGGYACQNGETTRWRIFLRADNLTHLDADEIQLLKDYGVRTVIDLRSREECAILPDPFLEDAGVHYLNIPLITENVADVTKTITGKAPQDFLKSFYIELIEHGQGVIKQILTEIASHGDGCLLFHCAAGKDRTGIVAMLLLGLAGVGAPDIVSNYEVTYTCLRQDSKFFEAAGPIPIEVCMSKPEYIEHVMAHIQGRYGGIPEYLERIGLPHETAETIRRRMRE